MVLGNADAIKRHQAILILRLRESLLCRHPNPLRRLIHVLINSLSVSMSGRVALTTRLQLLFDNQPSFLDVPLVTGGNPTGSTVPAQLEKVDAVFTVALVINLT